MKPPPYGKPWLLFALLGSSLALNVLMVLDRPEDPTTDLVASGLTQQADSVVVAEEPVAMTDEVLAAEVIVVSPDTEDHPPHGLSTPVVTPSHDGQWRSTHAEVHHSLARTFQGAVSEDADRVSALYSRLFMWDLDLRRDLQAGDRIRVAWRVANDEVEVAAATYQSRKLGRTLTAYRWQAPGDEYPSYWSTSGDEVAPRLVDGPLETYEQVTSLLKDRPDHKGMDFKTPVGTPVRTPWAGTVTRVNWRWTANGNCVEIKYDDGTVAKYLHLSELKTSEDARVQAGQVIALTGNTGRSTGPHLHYELNRDNRILDPVEVHGTTRRTLPAEVMPMFLEEVERLEELLNTSS